MRFDVSLVIPIVFKKRFKKDENMFTYYHIYYQTKTMRKRKTYTNKHKNHRALNRWSFIPHLILLDIERLAYGANKTGSNIKKNDSHESKAKVKDS